MAPVDIYYSILVSNMHVQMDVVTTTTRICVLRLVGSMHSDVCVLTSVPRMSKAMLTEGTRTCDPTPRPHARTQSSN